MLMKYPAHPGKIVKHDCIEALELTISDAANALGVHRSTLSRVINCRGSISPDMAIRLAKAFGSTPEHWLRMQHAYDLAQVRDKAASIHINRYSAPDNPPH